MYWKIKSLHGDYEVFDWRYEKLVGYLKFLKERKENFIVFVDENVLELYPHLMDFNPIRVPVSEETKTLVGIQPLIDEMISRGANSKTHIIAIGGGVIQDAVGFIASVWCRGVTYTLIPTTLLSQIDSCVGGKTSINHTRKNILGTFWPPNQIILCTDFLRTLSNTDYWSGWGEWIKYNILQKKVDFDFDLLLETHINDREAAFIEEGLGYKIDIINRDEFDKGERKFLNFGHTFGHALESISNWEIPHGYAVFIGSLIALAVDADRYEWNNDALNKLFGFAYEYLQAGGIQDKLKSEWFTGELIDIAKKSDKKQTGDGLTMILIGVSGPFIEQIYDDSVLLKAIERVRDEICG